MVLLIIILIVVGLVLLPIIFMILNVSTNINIFGGADDSLDVSEEQKTIKDAFRSYRE
ncbi:hypothetical protein IBE33_09250 [Francisella philomiragia]|uniref:hypothetical protein n=1 Tax=Francisella philomiragia TaxID=28110 RepID=UPI00190703BE|nr:hypothetical protein [Francisella philomiragia]MBK2341695.1 hypothetical protein [Francisella philomiragia]